MTRLIVIIFVALGWCFYVMSGGTNFEPRGLRDQQPQRIATTPKPAPTPIAPSQPKDLVTNVAVRTAPVREEAEPNPEPVEPIIIVEEVDSLRGFSQLPTFTGQDASFTLASLEDGAAGLRQTTTPKPDEAELSASPEPQKDTREIIGTRVNLRDGPGTIYPILGKLQLGQEVEVIGDSGTGWLRLRVLPLQQVGWISQSLVSKSGN
ncbi:SH3 domain-containing protein [Ruegeria sp.]|uniref:SH3 domain-containing protein n=1 Tax=Ruegeria sp. TaxID=1879320 RepID=UPI003C7DF6DB